MTTDDEHPFRIVAPQAFVNMSREALDDAPRFAFTHDPDASVGGFENNAFAFRVEIPRPLTDAEREEYEVRKAAKDAAREAFVAALTEAGGLAAALVALHKPNEYDDCAEESDTGSVEWYTPWPCDTLRLVAEHVGVVVPDDL